ncbi:MAG: HIT family protein [Nanoarchaeota archaeon]
MDCVFCKIVKKEEPSNIIYEDDEVLAFMDIHPINEGDILIIPKSHVPDFYNLNEKDYLAVTGIAKELSKKINKIFKPKKVGVVIAGFDVPHTHLHIVPMHDEDDITSRKLLENKMPKFNNKQLSKTAERIRGVKL